MAIALTTAEVDYVLKSDRLDLHVVDEEENYLNPEEHEDSYLELVSETERAGGYVVFAPQEPERTIFTIRPLSTPQYAEGQDMIPRGTAKYLDYVLRFGLVRFNFLTREDGGHIPWDERGVNFNIEKLDPDYRDELAFEILKLSNLSKDQTRDFSSPPDGLETTEKAEPTDSSGESDTPEKSSTSNETDGAVPVETS